MVRRIIELPNNTYNNLQSVYTNLLNTNLGDKSYEENTTLMMQLGYIADLLQNGYYDQFNEYSNNFDATQKIDDQLNPSSNDKIGLITGVSDYTFTDVVGAKPILKDIIHMIQNLTDNRYHVFWLSDEYLTTKLLNQTLNRIDMIEDQNTTFYYTYTGHIKELNSSTQAIVLNSGKLIYDSELNELFDILESENQLFIINTCYGESFADELYNTNRIIISATDRTSKAYTRIFADFTEFYQGIVDCWDWSLSVETNYFNLTQIFITIPVIIDPDEEEDMYL